MACHRPVMPCLRLMARSASLVVIRYTVFIGTQMMVDTGRHPSDDCRCHVTLLTCLGTSRTSLPHPQQCPRHGPPEGEMTTGTPDLIFGIRRFRAFRRSLLVQPEPILGAVITAICSSAAPVQSYSVADPGQPIRVVERVARVVQMHSRYWCVRSDLLRARWTPLSCFDRAMTR